MRAFAPAVAALDAELAAAVAPAALVAAVDDVPDEWLPPVEDAPTPSEQRHLYVDFLTARLADRSSWLPGGRRG